METILYFTITKDNEFSAFIPIGTIVSTGIDGIIEICTSISTTCPPTEIKRTINLNEVNWAILKREKLPENTTFIDVLKILGIEQYSKRIAESK
jgi:hypothetical protein